MQTVSIIGTAGRKKDLFSLDNNLYILMKNKSKEIIIEKLGLDPNKIILISAGAAWSDHIVVDLFLEDFIKKAILHLPAKWDSINKKYIENNDKYWDTGLTSNKLHYAFSNKTKKHSLNEIDQAIKKGIQIIDTYSNFHKRNTEVAKSDYLIAFTFSDDNQPNDGGTQNTWIKCKSKNKIHISINELNKNKNNL